MVRLGYTVRLGKHDLPGHDQIYLLCQNLLDHWQYHHHHVRLHDQLLQAKEIILVAAAANGAVSGSKKKRRNVYL